jgi:hypothetical protein
MIIIIATGAHHIYYTLLRTSPQHHQFKKQIHTNYR